MDPPQVPPPSMAASSSTSSHQPAMQRGATCSTDEAPMPESGHGTEQQDLEDEADALDLFQSGELTAAASSEQPTADSLQ